MRTGMNERRNIKNSIGRACFVALSVLLQIGWLVSAVTRAGRFFPYMSAAVNLLAMAVAIAIYSQHRSSASKTIWIVLVLFFPVLGLFLYLLVGQPWATYSIRRRFDIADHRKNHSPGGEGVIAEVEAADFGAAAQMRYLKDWCHYPAYKNTQVEFHSQTDAAFASLKAELKKAEKFIFMEYHAIQLSDCFLEIEEILAERAKAGVEVRLFYDDAGSAVFINRNFVKRMEGLGIRCHAFNPLIPMVSAFMNNRDHRKITVIDGKVGFTGGYNLANEYFNLNSPYGHWKDTGILLRGKAVRSLTLTFLDMWNAVKREDEDYRLYLPECSAQSDGYVQPYADSPLDDERTGENVYLNLLKNARNYVWITTPYLILDEEMVSELTLAAKRGVDVRIITPGIPDKKLVYRITRSNYAQLVRGGVRIWEYTPGFLHAKQMVSDGISAVVGTINLDYRSLYLHFENAVFMHRCAAIADIHRDFEESFPICREVTKEYAGRRPMGIRIVESLLRLFAPFL